MTARNPVIGDCAQYLIVALTSNGIHTHTVAMAGAGRKCIPAMATDHSTLVAVLDGLVCYIQQSLGSLITVLIHMEVQIKVSLLCQCEDSANNLCSCHVSVAAAMQLAQQQLCYRATQHLIIELITCQVDCAKTADAMAEHKQAL